MGFIIIPTQTGYPTKAVSQTAHGFTIPTEGFIPVYLDDADGLWKAAQADSDNTMAMANVVAVADANNFTVQLLGSLTALAHGLTVGNYYYLSDTVAGGLTTAEPTRSQPVAFISSASEIELLQLRAITTGDSAFISAFDATTSWTGPATGLYTLTIAAATHGLGTAVSHVQVQEDDGTDYVDVTPTSVEINKTTGDIIVTVADVPDSRFLGRAVIYK